MVTIVKGPSCPIPVSAVGSLALTRAAPERTSGELRWRQHIGSAASHHYAHHPSGPPGALCNMRHALAGFPPQSSLRAL